MKLLIASTVLGLSFGAFADIEDNQEKFTAEIKNNTLVLYRSYGECDTETCSVKDLEKRLKFNNIRDKKEILTEDFYYQLLDQERITSDNEPQLLSAQYISTYTCYKSSYYEITLENAKTLNYIGFRNLVKNVDTGRSSFKNETEVVFGSKGNSNFYSPKEKLSMTNSAASWAGSSKFTMCK